ncbi:hypothetical protein AA0116_g3649 [Alternaria tenuissima]|nr:hypothetical protein AA0116_g3649 [Alternaria tenuissima]
MTSRQHNRFSWQQPLEEDAPAYPQSQQQTPQHQHQPYQQPYQQPAQLQQSQVSTDASRHFSYAQTPAEMRAFVYTSSPNDPPMPQSIPISLPTSPVGYTPIDPRPQSMLDAQLPVVPPQSQSAYTPSSYAQDVKPPVSPVSPQHTSQTQHFSPVSPIPQPQPNEQRSEVDTQQSRHARQMSNLSPINTNIRTYAMPPIPPTPPSGTHQTSPLPHKTPITPVSANSMHKDQPRIDPTSPTNRISPYPNEPYSPHGFTSGQNNNFHAVFSPDAAHGPNGLDFAAHQPGQISHPNMELEKSKEWSNGLFMGLSCGLWWLFPMLQRTRIRRAYKLDGSFGSDLLKGCCCCCCVTVQNEREVKHREEVSRRWAGPASTDAYTRTGGMVYKPQQ